MIEVKLHFVTHPASCKMRSAVASLPAVLLLLATVTLTLTTATAQSTYTLLDRTTSFQTTPPQWSKRADVTIERSETGYPQIKYQQHKRAAEGYAAGQALYQVALVPGNGAVVGTQLSEIKGQVVSVKNVRTMRELTSTCVEPHLTQPFFSSPPSFFSASLKL